jgi:hypothetical protein
MFHEVSWTYNYNIWQAFLKIWNQMEIRQVPWIYPKKNELQKHFTINWWWPFLKISDQMKKQNVPWSSPKKQEAHQKFTVHIVSKHLVDIPQNMGANDNVQ